MGTPGVTLAAVLGAVAIAVTAGASAAGGSKTAHLTIPLPAPNQARVSLVTVTVTAPNGKGVGSLKVSATNAAELGGPQLNTQTVAAIWPRSSSKQSSTFKVWVFIHRYPPAPAAARSGFGADTPSADLTFSGATGRVAKITGFGLRSCQELAHETVHVPDFGRFYINFLGDNFLSLPHRHGPRSQIEIDNLVIEFDTATEEQLDEAVSQCSGAEKPEAGSK